MLFRLVFGPELEEVWRFAAIHGAEASKDEAQRWFVQADVRGQEGTNLEEALTVLRTAGLIQGTDRIAARPTTLPFRLTFLERLRDLALGRSAGVHPLDDWYLRLVDMLAVGPDISYLSDLHMAANRLNPPVPFSDEKLNAWRRVMEWLGLGRRVGCGFIVTYSPDLVGLLLDSWANREGALEEFLATHVHRFLPWMSHHGDLPQALLHPLSWLERQGLVELTPRQDLPGKAYWGVRRLKWITWKGVG